MPYECKTDMEQINGEIYYYVWTGRGYIVYHWNRPLGEMDRISSNFFIKLENARACARDDAKNYNYKERLKAELRYLQDELERLEENV